MLVALKAVYEMLKTACEAHTARKSAEKEAFRKFAAGDEGKKYKEEIATLKKENAELLAEQAKAIKMIEEMADYLEKH
tara:strand:+ start:486 stop:719 length:234 start_codon:yes stop_codon:yes gene_type:complete